uniref:REJ domain-containing protein n=1 Tax=Macrostomum lignano TaxID=282301 RepID=A0A1I8FBX8_9PLAT
IASQSTFSAVAETAAADAATPQSSSIQTDFFVPSMSSAVNSVSAAETSTATVSAATSEFTEPDITAAPPAATSAETGASLGVSESAGTTDSTGSPTGTASAPTTLATCRPKLNLSPNLSPFWVLTVLQSVTSATDVSACQWADDMESLLLTLLTESQALSSTGVFAENSSLRLQLVSATRDAGSERVSLVYYAMSAGGAAYLPADSVVSAINGNSARVPVVLGYSVESPAASVYDSAAAASSSKLWVIGAVLGCLGALLLIVWAVLFAYHKCLRPYEAPKFAHQHEGPAAEELEFLAWRATER